MDFNLIQWTMRGKRRKSVLKYLKNNIKNPKLIAKELGFTLTNTSTTLKQLKDKKLVICKNPEDAFLRFYKITELGKEVLKEIKKLEE